MAVTGTQWSHGTDLHPVHDSYRTAGIPQIHSCVWQDQKPWGQILLSKVSAGFGEVEETSSGDNKGEADQAHVSSRVVSLTPGHCTGSRKGLYLPCCVFLSEFKHFWCYYYYYL